MLTHFHANLEICLLNAVEKNVLTLPQTGGLQSEEERYFEKHTINNCELEITNYEKINNDENNVIRNSPLLIYLCTDGFQDQFGGENNKKFMVKNLKKQLFEISEKPMAEQKQVLETTISDWISVGNEKQTDDICVLGIRI